MFPESHTLELKVPPVALALLVSVAMWGVALVFPSIGFPFFSGIIPAVVFSLVGAGISLAGVIAFRRARTTVNPTIPKATSALVDSGIYRVTRNPMYVGFLFMLIGWALLLSNAATLFGPLIFVVYINRFQIAPEERALFSLFGAQYLAYTTRVRRWL
ncbi:MAG: isoprenylcysteine carboxylmethyltransferase family protein [Rhodoferax sp.]|nr:isoprenylcysteine carboxylmethyltransferase family protein [Rhodoferax sp.]